MERTYDIVRKRPINPFVDWGFKYVFGREENKDLLIGFLNLLLEPEVAITDIRHLNSELLGDSPELKRCVVDVLATDKEGNRYLVEMQNAPDLVIRQRLVYYACRLIDQMGQHRQEWSYGQIKRVYAICLMNFTYERNATLREDYQLRNEKGDRLFSDLLTIIPLQIPCIKAKNASECRKSYEVLLFLLQSISKRMATREELLAEIDTLDLPEQILETFRRVVNTVEDDLTPEQWRDYELDLDKYQRTMGMIRTGRIEGREEGREEGRIEGIAEGREEERQRIAKTMKENGFQADMIIKCCGLSKDEIARL
jgi:predicted transposase/invertase (TIGR01784 family)